MHRGLWWGNLNESNNLENREVYGIDLVGKGCDPERWMLLVQVVSGGNLSLLLYLTVSESEFTFAVILGSEGPYPVPQSTPLNPILCHLHLRNLFY
jgi:hypothetical protein